jgi:hypothetical protein
MANRMEGVNPVVLVQSAASSELVSDPGFFLEGQHTGICSGATEDRARTAMDEREILLRGLVDSLVELAAHLH